METADFLFLAVVQGVAEFLPISSSGHLVLLGNVMGFDTQGLFFFNILVHTATLLAAIVFYRNDLKLLIVELLRELGMQKYFPNRFLQKTQEGRNSSPLTDHALLPTTDFSALRFIRNILLTTTVTGMIGIMAKSWVEGFHHLGFLALFFFLTGVILWTTRKKSSATSKKFSVDDLTIPAALLIGLAQGVAILPGFSRSGITIAAGILWGLSNPDAMRYSIFISLPLIAGVFLLELIEMVGEDITGIDYGTYAGAFAVSFLMGYLSLHLLFQFMKQRRIHLFTFYLIPLSLGLGIYYVLGVEVQ